MQQQDFSDYDEAESSVLDDLLKKMRNLRKAKEKEIKGQELQALEDQLNNLI